MLPLTSDMSILDRMVLAVERVRDRLIRSSAALEAAGIPYAIAGGNAVAAWVATIDAAAVRNTQDVDVLLRRSDIPAAAAALAKAGFIHEQVQGIDVFLDGPQAKIRDSIHTLIAGEKVKDHYAAPTPDVTESENLAVVGAGAHQVRVVALESLVRMKLTSFRDKDRTHLRDMLDVGLIQPSWTQRFPSELASRLQQLIDTPEG